MIQFNQVSFSRGAKVIVQNAQTTLFPKEKVGLVGLNGAGKSSLLSALLGEITLDQGNIEIPSSWQIAWIEQEVQDNHHTVIDFVLEGDRALTEIRQAIAKAEEQSKTQGEDHQLGHLYEQYENLGGYTAQARMATILHGLGFKKNDLERKVGEFSGGWKMRMNLARVLGSRAELVLLDEPTNHLDIDAVLWLEQWIRQIDCMVIVVSHDRDFLDEVCTHTLHLHNEKLNKYTGGYSAFERAFSERAEQIELTNRKAQQEMQKLQKFVDRFKAKATKAKQAQSRVKRLEKIQLIESMGAMPTVQLQFQEPHKSPDPLVVLENSHCGYQADNPILGNVTLEVRPGDRIGLLGANGNGKTTLIRSIVGQLPLLSGQRTEGKGLVCGYFAQDQIESLDLSATPLQHFTAMAPEATEQALRSFLATFHFTGDKVNQIVGGFSGGEKSRLALALLAWHKPNILLLDEPTNHLDIATRQALANALVEFEGALIVVSHDRHLLESITDVFWKVSAGKVQSFEGDLNDYAQEIRKDNQTERQTESKPTGLSKQQRQEDMNRLKKARNQLKKVESQLPALQKELAEIDTQTENADYSSEAGQKKAIELAQARELKAKALDESEEAVLELMMEIETLEANLGMSETS